jgi:hypothetical protein
MTTLIPRRDQVTEPAMQILMHSELLEPHNCKNFDGVIFELCHGQFEEPCYRMFFSTDDYDYLFMEAEQPLVDKLNELFGAKAKLAN